MKCYFQGCKNDSVSKEHIPSKSFFPKGKNIQLLIVPSCNAHNTLKSDHDLYVLAHICLHVSPQNGAYEVFKERIGPQLSFNNNAFRKTLLSGAVPLENGAVKYAVNVRRFDSFFNALSFGLVFKSQNSTLPDNYKIGHVYSSLVNEGDGQSQQFPKMFKDLILSQPPPILVFGNPKFWNKQIYTDEIFGMPNFKSNVTIVHTFFGIFRVVSFLTRMVSIGDDGVGVLRGGSID